MRQHFIELTGKVFGCLTVLGKSSIKNYGHQAHWKCVCKCGYVGVWPSQDIRKSPKYCRKCPNKYKISDNKIVNGVYARYKGDAKRYNRIFELTVSELGKFINSNCFYCGAPPINGIDRVNNSIGYVLANCRTCCKICNRAKREMSELDFFSWIVNLCRFNNERNNT